jgi:toxin ParE1/3/4
MVRIVWNEPALRDIEKIRAHVAQFDPKAAQRLADRIVAAGESLSEFPNRGRLAGNRRRELAIVPPYIIRYRYRASDETVYITRIKHGRQAS